MRFYFQMKPFNYRIWKVILAVIAICLLCTTYLGWLKGMLLAPPDKIRSWFPHFGNIWLFVRPFTIVVSLICALYLLLLVFKLLKEYLVSNKKPIFQFISTLGNVLRKIVLFLWNK
jgi:hypothetical protein